MNEYSFIMNECSFTIKENLSHQQNEIKSNVIIKT